MSYPSFAGQTITLLIQAADAESPSLIEAAFDDLVIGATPSRRQVSAAAARGRGGSRCQAGAV